ncbi:MAG: hypothetical protein GWO87_02405, partial [Xanthomonadaceae bacterium]|nr:hypothetical protein [Rhodospirillaceae bacterium]NIA18016.1 hypothetical protein [Xanthomonadaceae bacterium]
VILILRRHWFIFFKSFFVFLIAIPAPIIFYIFINSLCSDLFNYFIFKIIFFLFLSSYYLSIWLFLFSSFVDYYLDVWIVTNQRILNIEQKALFSRVVSEQKIERIQDITSEVHGILPTFLDYGDVHIQNAGALEKFIFKEIPRPASIRKKILTFIKQRKKFKKILEKKDKIKI